MDTINAGLFPISFNAHIIFTIIAVLFFLMQYIRLKQKYQLLSAIAIPIPLILYVNSSSIIFHAVGFVELILVVIIGFMLFKNNNKKDDVTKKESTNNET